ncbi:MAG: ParM/StbA family protein [Okeania sp. SIO1H6]|nr:ParM/StbA family protein [Okeania sp. SIO1H6]
MGRSLANNKVDINTIVVAIDLGSSLTKVVWGTKGKTNFLTMEPEVIQCDRQHLDVYRGKRLQLKSSSANDAWINLNNNISQSFVVGFLASILLAEANLKAPKYESALYKILAVLGIIAEQQQDRFDVALTTLLPYSEWTDQSKLKQEIEEAVKSFWFRGKRVRLRLRRCQCLPEGLGITMSRYQDLSQNIPSSVVTLVFGHRNTSILEFQRGVFSNANTTNLGFFRLIDQVVELTSSQERNGLHEAIFKLGDPVDSNNPILYQMCKSTTSDNQETETSEIIKAIQTAQEYYWTLINEWLQSKLPKRIHEVVIAGGVAQYLKHKLRERLHGIDTYWGGDWQDVICRDPSFQKDHPNEEDRHALAFRLIDAYTAYHFQIKTLIVESQEPQESLATQGSKEPVVSRT